MGTQSLQGEVKFIKKDLIISKGPGISKIGDFQKYLR